MNLTEKQKEILDKYNIKHQECKSINELLEVIDNEMTTYMDKNDEPLPEFLELEKLYDEIFEKNNK